MALNRYIQKPQFLTKIALAFLVFLGCADIVIWGIAAKLISEKGDNYSTHEKIVMATHGQASLASFWQGITCFFGINCSAAQAPSPNTQIANNTQSTNNQYLNEKDEGTRENTNANVVDKGQTSVSLAGGYAEDRPSDANTNTDTGANHTIIQNINPTKEIQTKEVQTIHTNTVTEHTNTVVVDEDTKNKVDLLLRQLDSDRPNYSVGQTYTLPANLLGTTLNIGAGNFTIGASGDANAQNITTEHDLTVRGNFSVTGAQTYTGAASFTSSNASSTLATANTGTGFALQADNLTLKTNAINTATGNLILNSSTGLIEIAGTGIKLTNAVPSDTSMALYNDSGTLKWNGAALAMGSSVSGTVGYVPKFTSSNALGNSVLFENGGNVGIGTTAPGDILHVAGNIRMSGYFKSDSPYLFATLNDNYQTIKAGALAITTDYANNPPANGLYVQGSVGVGTLTPDYKLDVAGGVRVEGANVLYFGGTGTNDWQTRMYNNNGVQTINTNGLIINDYGYTGSKNYLTILSNGNVGIGTTAPGDALTVIGNVAATQFVGTVSSDTLLGARANQNIIFRYGASEAMRINSSGNVGVGIAVPLSRIDLAGNMAMGSFAGVYAAPANSFILGGGKMGIGTAVPGNALSIQGGMAIGDGTYTNSATAPLYGAVIQGNVGIGTTAPGYKLDVNGGFRVGNATSTNGFVFDPATGNVGIGIAAAAQKLNVQGNAYITSGIVVNSGAGIGDGFAASKILFNNTNGVSIYTNSPSTEQVRITNAGNVGIGTTAPASSLQVATGGLFSVTGTYGSGAALPSGLSGDGTRLFFYPKKAAFRAGTTEFGYWDDPNIGNYSVAMGYRTKASGGASVAIGDGANASGSISAAFGFYSSATAAYSTAFGMQSSASAPSAVAMGQNTQATGSYSTSMNGYTVARHFAETVIGSYNIAPVIIDNYNDAYTWIPTSPIFEIGIGTSAGNKANAMTVLKNGNIGIGAVAPLARLQVLGDNDTATSTAAFFGGATTAGLVVLNSGSVGIGTTNPNQRLEVNGDIRLNGNGTYETLYMQGNAVLSKVTATGRITLQSAGGDVSIRDSGGTDRIFVQNSSGNVGIGTTTPREKLDVESGNIVINPGYSLSVKYLADNTSRSIIGTSDFAGLYNINVGNTSGIFNDLRFSAAGAGALYAMVIQKATGNVGIGTTVPTSKFTVRGDNAGYITDLLRLENLGTASSTTGVGMQFIANRTTGGVTEFGRIDSLITSIDNTYYSGAMRFKIAANGALETVMEMGNPNIVMNRPLEVNVAGDTGINYDLTFMNTGMSRITSYGPLMIEAGSPDVYDNLILSLAGDSTTNGGDIIADIRYSNTTFGGFKITGADNGGYVFKVDPNGNVGIGGNGSGSGSLIVKQNLTLTGGNIIVQKLSSPTNLTCVPQGNTGASTYRFQVTALNENGETTASTLCETTTGNAILDATNYVLLAWDPVSGATKYRVYGCSGAACTPTLDNDTEPHASSPTNTYNVDDSSFSAAALPTTNTSGGNLAINRASASYALDVLSTGTNIARFNGTNNTGCTLSDGGIIACSSDERLKKNIEETIFGINDIMKLRPVSFNWTTDQDNASSSIGFIAQEVEGILPHLVMTDANGYKELNTIGLVPVLVRAIQEQQGDITRIKLALIGKGILDSQSEEINGQSQDVFDTVGGAFNFMGMTIKDGVARLRSLATNGLTIGSSEAPAGFTMFDKETGKAYCVEIVNGEFTKRQGECVQKNESDQSTGQAVPVTETPTGQIPQETVTPPAETNSTTTDETVVLEPVIKLEPETANTTTTEE